ncbi:oligosaccharide flippase family protein [Chitinophaga sp. Mgbs1]|uniref:Oligosaccharide flippase family protein n=1 Tax=Chitinophaga solisilvae TaxID=1233460 RepID=A0A433WDV1_9BACT|nr:oligosaccharide flippase family protein [Chitinophaga solisilvae]
MKDKGFLKGTITYALGDIIPKILAFISFPILTSYLTTGDYGIVNYVNSLTMFLLVFNILGLNTYYLVHYHKCSSDEERQRLLGNLSIFIFFYNIGVLLLFSAGGFFFGKYVEAKIPFWPFVFIAVLSGFFNVFSLLPLASLRLKQKSVQFAGLNIAKNITQLGLTVIFVVFLRKAAIGVLYSILIANVVFFFYYAIYCYRHAIFKYDKEQIVKALRFAVPLVPGSLAYLFINLLDRIIIARYLTLGDLGLYGTATTLGFLINIISTGFYQALEPHIFKSYNTPGFRNEFKRIRSILLLVLLSAAMGLALFAREFLYFMSNKGFHIAYVYVPVILAGGIFSGLNLLYATVITASGKTRVNSMNVIIGCAVSIGLNFILVPWIGITGAAIAFTAAFLIILLLSMAYSRFPIFAWQEIVVSLVWVACIYFLVYSFSPAPGIYSIAIKALTMVLFMVFAFKLLGIKGLKSLF